MAGTTISTPTTVALNLTLASQNPVNVTATGSIVVNGVSAISSQLTTPVTITNLGKIATTSSSGDGISLAAGGSVTNGSMTASITGGVFGILTGSSNPTTVTNDGTITATANVTSTGIESSGTGKITITNGSNTDTKAAITGSFDGIQTVGVTMVTNFGAIAGSNGGVVLGNGGNVTNGSASDTTASITGGVRIAGSSPAAVTNFGSIAGGVALASGTIVNGSASDKGATITAASTGNGIVLGGGGGTITNFGTIKSTIADIVLSSGTGAVTINNFGTIASSGAFPSIVFGGGADKLVDNAGSTISGPLGSFRSNDSIDLPDVPSTGVVLAYNSSTGVLDVNNNSGATLRSLIFQNETLGAGTFHIASDGSGGSLITHS
jgi:hypothetical protein